jgi:CHAT domain-containing protein
LISTFENQYPRYHNLKYGQNRVSVEQLQNSIDGNTALISYLESDSSITAFLITPEQMKIARTKKADNYTRLIKRLRMKLTSSYTRQKDEYIKVAQRLYQQLFPMELPEKINNLVIIPDGKMALIPFETLLTKKNIQNPNDFSQYPYLIKQYNISYSYSAELYHRTLPKKQTKEVEVTSLHDWLALAPVFDREKTGVTSLRTREMLSNLDSFSNDSVNTRGRLLNGRYISSLPGTKEEVKKVFKQFDRKDKKALVQLHEKASEEYVKSGKLKKFKFLHFASHGIVNTKKPELSGIILAQDSTSQEDCILHTGEMYNLNLNADLTVLSACETGLGKIREGEGLIGLTRALLYAGSKNIIVSLWKVADVSTTELIVDFYNNFLDKKPEARSYTEALRQAKLKMISNEKYAHPFYWSPFILVGK